MSARTNEAWLADLHAEGPPREAAIEDLRAIIQRGLPYALSRWLSPDHPLFNPLVEEITQETLLRVLDQLDTFEGRSMFTTWVHKIAIRLALTELRRKRWQDSFLDEMVDTEEAPTSPRLLIDPQVGPETNAERATLIKHIRQILEQELTPKQRQAILLIALQDLPIEDVARRMKTHRNALYKLLHDARLRLRQRLERDGISAQEVLSAFETRQISG
ncbi:MAG: RNA polymerase sigma factor [Anaerolineae bacterium]